MSSASGAVGVADGPVGSPARAVPQQARPVPERLGQLWPLALYALLSLLLFGLPVVGHLDSRIIAADPIDSSQFMWFFAWWPHALLHGLNPFVTHLLFVPQGFNLTWATAMPGPSVLLSPITLAFGPAVTWNLIQLCSPALSGWTAFLLARHLTGHRGASLIAGYVFGFSPYMLNELIGAPYLALVPLLPVFVLLVLCRLEGSITARRFLISMTLALTGQYLISGEVLTTSTLFGGIALALAYALFAERRPALRGVVKLLVGAYAATAVLLSPFLYFFLFGHHYPPGKTFFSADLASLVLPPPLVAIARQRPPFVGANSETYLGLPLLALIAAFLWRQRRNRIAWLLGASLTITAICSLGEYVVVRGHKTSIPGPWIVLAHLPVLHYAIPVRFALFSMLAAALIISLWLSKAAGSGRGRAIRWGLAALSVAMIVPRVGSSAWDTHIADPAFFADGESRAYLKPADNVMTVPAFGPNERWQADTGFRFRLAGGYAGNPLPASYTSYPTFQTLLTGRLTPDYAAQLRRFIKAKHVTAIIVDQTAPGPWRKLFGSLGVVPVDTGGVLFYRVSQTTPIETPAGRDTPRAISTASALIGALRSRFRDGGVRRRSRQPSSLAGRMRASSLIAAIGASRVVLK